MSHTPGPWKVTENYRECIEGADGGTVAWYVATANAHLIAAAPDMLADCADAQKKVCLFMCDAHPLAGPSTHCELCLRMQATIAKAKAKGE